jgi:hypothetical protein
VATLNSSLILAQQPYKPPTDFNLGDTLVQAARLKAYRQQQALEELRLGQAQHAQDRQAQFEQIMSGVFTPQQAPPQGPPPGAPPGPPPGQPPGMPPGLPSADRGLTMAQAVPPATPQQGSYAMAPPPAGPRGLSSYAMAPIDLQSRAGLEAQAGPPGAPMMNVGMAGTPLAGAMPARGSGAPASGAPPPPASGLGAAEPQRSQIPGLNQPLNEQVLMRAFSVNPEATGKWLTGYTEMQGKKLEQAEKVNTLIYDNIKALEQSPDPAGMYPEMLKNLRAKGVPVPDNFPSTYQPALMKFLLQSHRGVKTELEEARTRVEGYKALNEKAQAGKHEAETGRVPYEIAHLKAQTVQNLAQAGKAEAEAKRVPEEIADLKSQQALRTATIGKTTEEILNLVNERKAKLAQVTPYTTDSKKNVYLSNAAQTLKLPPGTPPTAAVIELARQYEVEDELKVARDHGLNAAKAVLPAAEAKRLDAVREKGTAMEGLENTLDEIERLIAEGVYTNQPDERLKAFLANTAGVRDKDPMAARTARLYELGNELALEKAGGKLGGQVSDTDLRVIQSSGGNLQAAKSALAMQESLKSIRRIAKINLDDANKGWKRYKETGSLGEFGANRRERLKLLTQADIAESMKANNWTREQAIANAQRGGYRVED